MSNFIIKAEHPTKRTHYRGTIAHWTPFRSDAIKYPTIEQAETVIKTLRGHAPGWSLTVEPAKRAAKTPSRIVHPFRVMFAPGDQKGVSNAEFVGHQHGGMEPWDGFDTAAEAKERADNLNGDSIGEYRHWLAVEIREV